MIVLRSRWHVDESRLYMTLIVAIVWRQWSHPVPSGGKFVFIGDAHRGPSGAIPV